MEAVGIAHGHHEPAQKEDKAVGAAQLLTGAAYGFDRIVVRELAHEKVHDDLCVTGPAENGTLVLKPAPQFERVHQVAVVGDGDVHPLVVDKEGLGVGYGRTSRGGVAHVPHGDGAGQGLEVFLLKYIGHEPHAPVVVDIASVIHAHDARAFLPPVLLGIEAEIGESGSVHMTVDAEKATIFVYHCVSFD